MKLPNKKYNTIVIDPPWNITMTGKNTTRPNRARELPYKTMTFYELKQFPIHQIANQGSHIYLWATNKTLKDAFTLLSSWGVNFHLVLVWTKPSAIAPCFAYKFATEFLLLGFYGKPMQKFIGKGKLNWITHFTKPGEHSMKPEKMYDLIREMSAEPRIDIFSRREINGFDCWGNEAPLKVEDFVQK